MVCRVSRVNRVNRVSIDYTMPTSPQRSQNIFKPNSNLKNLKQIFRKNQDPSARSTVIDIIAYSRYDIYNRYVDYNEFEIPL